MKNLKVWWLGALVLGGSSCALLNAVKTGNVSGVVSEGAKVKSEVVDGAMEIKAAADKEAEAKCGGLETKVVPLDEEKAIGGAIAVGLTQKFKANLFIDGNTEKDPEVLRQKVEKGQPVTLPDSEKNNLSAYLSVVGRGLASFSSRPELGWTFGVLESPTVNAFSAPGGYVYVTTGLLKVIDNEAMLAGVLAHEIGHVTGRHTVKAYSKVKFTQCNFATKGGVYIARGAEKVMPDSLREHAAFAKYFSGGKLDLDADDVAGGFIAKLTDGFIDSYVNKGLAFPDEFEADKTAVELVTFAGYDPGEYENLLRKLPANSDDHHPPMAERLAKIKTVRDENAAFAGKLVKPDNSAQLKVVKK